MQPLYPSLVFPDTDIFSYRRFPLLLFGGPVHFLQLLEPDSEKKRRDREPFIAGGLCRPCNPAPLADDQQRFRRLVDDIKNRTDDYAAQLSALTVAAMSGNDEESAGEKRHQLISSMLSQATPMDSRQTASQLERWQARLVLAISEILLEEEEELRQELQLLDAREIAMFRSLQGESDTEEDDPFSLIERITNRLEHGRPREMKMRFRSWLTLMKSEPIPDISLFLAASADAADQLITLYEKNHSGTPLPILKLSVPERIEAGPIHVVSQVQRFHAESAEVRGKIYADLDLLTSSERGLKKTADSLLPGGPDRLNRWNELVENHFPAGSHGTSSLRFYLLPDCTVPELLGLESGSAAPRPTHGLFAVLTEQR